MSFTYNSALSSAKDVVRLNLGDTIAAGAYLQDEEINAILTAESGNSDKATIRLARGLAARFAREISIRKTGREEEAGLHEDVIARAKFFKDLADGLEKKLKEDGKIAGIGLGSSSGGAGSAGGDFAFRKNLHKVD